MDRLTKGGDVIKENNKQFWIGKKYDFHYTDVIIQLSPKYDTQPDLLAHDFYGSSTYEWLILYYNNISDPWTEFKTGTTIRLPNLNRIV